MGRRVAYDLGMEQFDHTTYQPTRIMYYPSTAADGEFKPEYRDAAWLDPDAVLALYPDWRDTSYWPMAARTEDARKREAKKQGNPLEKPGLIGAFCRCYDVDTAISKFLPGVYTPCALPGRYTYAQGSTAAGLVVYDDGQFAFSTTPPTRPPGSCATPSTWSASICTGTRTRTCSRIPPSTAAPLSWRCPTWPPGTWK